MEDNLHYRILNSSMEVLDKREYFRFYNHNRSTHSNKSKIKHQTKKYEGLRPLPHISEEYNYRITNHLLIKKIISPRRDKVILHSLEGVSKQSSGHSRSGTRERWRTSHKNRSHYVTKHSRSTTKLIRDETEEPKINIIRRRAKNVGKVIQNNSRESPYWTIHSNMDKQVNTQCQYTEIISVPQTRSFHREKQNHSKDYSLGYRFNNPQSGFGSGPTIIKITDIRIEENPSIKGDTLVQLELIERSAYKKEVQRIFFQKKEKTIKTNPIQYSQLPQQNDAETSIKFNLTMTKIGDFIPLRIWKYIGVECSLVGTVDLPLISYGDEEQELENQPRQVKQKTVWQTKNGDSQLTRKVIYGIIERKLMKVKMHEGQAKIFLKYKVYPKRFKKITKEDPCIQS